jgi:hypothetical protein
MQIKKVLNLTLKEPKKTLSKIDGLKSTIDNLNRELSIKTCDHKFIRGPRSGRVCGRIVSNALKYNGRCTSEM